MRFAFNYAGDVFSHFIGFLLRRVPPRPVLLVGVSGITLFQRQFYLNRLDKCCPRPKYNLWLVGIVSCPPKQRVLQFGSFFRIAVGSISAIRVLVVQICFPRRLIFVRCPVQKPGNLTSDWEQSVIECLLSVTESEQIADGWEAVGHTLGAVGHGLLHVSD